MGVRRSAMDAQFLNAEQNGRTVSMGKSTAAVIVVALLGAGALASWSMQGPVPSRAVTTFMGSVSRQEPKSAVELLATNFKNATILEPSMLYYSNCLLCYTCGGGWYYRVAVANRGAYFEFHAGCSNPDHYTSNDDAYVCCRR